MSGAIMNKVLDLFGMDTVAEDEEEVLGTDDVIEEDEEENDDKKTWGKK